jgi:D-serine ammonia-lyase
LARLSGKLGDGAVSVFVDHPQQLKYVSALAEASGNKPLVFLKVDMGTHRAGVIPGSDLCNETVEALLEGERQGQLVFHGLYAHAGQSYEARTDWKGLDLLHEEVASLAEVAGLVQARCSGHPLNLSVGATPTVASLQHPNLSEAAPELMKLISELKDKGYGIEVHAGVYPTLDLQQLATHARDDRFMTAQDIGISILADVVSLYPGRGPNGTTEALINAGTLGLAREPVADMGAVPGRDYKSWGIVMPWGVDNVVPGKEFPAVHGGWQVMRTSQEHGILGWVGRKEEEVPLEIGQRVRIWPNHSCITGAGHDHYLVVDSRKHGQEDEIIDIWPRWRGWTTGWSG